MFKNANILPHYFFFQYVLYLLSILAYKLYVDSPYIQMTYPESEKEEESAHSRGDGRQGDCQEREPPSLYIFI